MRSNGSVATLENKIFELLNSLGVKYRVANHKAVFTVAEAALQVKDKRPIKNLALKEEKGERLVLVIMDGRQKMDTKKIAKALGIKKLQFAKPALLKTMLGVEPGSVSLFNVLYAGSENVEVVIERSLLDGPEVGFHPGVNTSTVFIPASAIENILRKTGHTYHICPM